jgi:hypothetical protein
MHEQQTEMQQLKKRLLESWTSNEKKSLNDCTKQNYGLPIPKRILQRALTVVLGSMKGT